MKAIAKKLFLYVTIGLLPTNPILPISVPFSGISANTDPNRIDFLNRKHLQNHKAVKKRLLANGFKEISFSTTDHQQLSGLFLERPQAKATVIVVIGFCGRKEHAAPFFYLLPKNYNLLFFDPRSRGESTGSPFRKLGSYGKNDYKDVIGALEYVKSQTKQPIILYGCCSGAFNSAHALIKLQEEGKLNNFSIKGLIFDSGWGSVKQTVPYFLRNMVKRVSSIGLIFMPIITALKKLFFDHKIEQTDKKTNIMNKMKTLKIPIFFIHSIDDDIASFNLTYRLAESISNKQCWWIPQGQSVHARHHLKHPYEYSLRLRNFCAQTLR